MNLTVLYIGFECCKYDFLIISFAYVPCKVNAKMLCKVTPTWGDFAQNKLFLKNGRHMNNNKNQCCMYR